MPKLTITPIPQNSALANLYPDLAYIPIYPGSTEEDKEYNNAASRNDHIGMRHFVYFPPADASLVQVVQFYREALSKNGWDSVGDTLPAFTTNEQALQAKLLSPHHPYFIWTDPEDRTPWHFYVEVEGLARMEMSGEIGGLWINVDHEGRIFVQLRYGRIPDDVKNLPVYPGTTQVDLACSTEPGFVTEITKSYLTSATPEQLAEFYNSMLPTYSWRFYDEDVLQRVMYGQVDDINLVFAKQAGDITSEGGLVFQGMASNDERGVISTRMLHITSHVEGGRTKVQLKVELKADEYHCADIPTDAPAPESCR